MRLVGPYHPETLYGGEATRAIERAAAAALPPHSLMALAGLSVAQLTRALSPHARRVWVACGPGNNGGDGLVAATHLHQRAVSLGGAQQVVVTLCSDPHRLPADAAHALERARSAGVCFADQPPDTFDFAIDALLGFGTSRPPEGRLAAHLAVLHRSQAPLLCVDVPSGLNTDTGVLLHHDDEQRPGTPTPGARHTLSLLTLKPGLFTADGRDQAGQVWFDDLGIAPPADVPALAKLNGRPRGLTRPPIRAHATHKGSFGDVLVIGGQDIAMHGAGMTGAAVLAARAALHSGAGRVYLGLLENGSESHPLRWDPACPELMLRRTDSLLMQRELLQQACVVCGCGGGNAIARVLPNALTSAHMLVLDADALNAIARDGHLRTQLRQRSASGWITVLTPHPLEAARLLETSTTAVMADRLAAAEQLAHRFSAICVLKGSGSVISAPGQTPLINPTGNAALATAGTGDVLAGMIGSALALRELTPDQAFVRVADAVFQHGWLADQWSGADASSAGTTTLTAARLASSVFPLPFWLPQ